MKVEFDQSRTRRPVRVVSVTKYLNGNTATDHQNLYRILDELMYAVKRD
jgi:hypothetical protein